MKVVDLTHESFAERVSDFQQYPNGWEFKGNRPCIVDFHAPWCIYCKRLSPVLDELAVEYDGKIDFIKWTLIKNLCWNQPFPSVPFRISCLHR